MVIALFRWTYKQESSEWKQNYIKATSSQYAVTVHSASKYGLKSEYILRSPDYSKWHFFCLHWISLEHVLATKSINQSASKASITTLSRLSLPSSILSHRQHCLKTCKLIRKFHSRQCLCPYHRDSGDACTCTGFLHASIRSLYRFFKQFDYLTLYSSMGKIIDAWVEALVLYIGWVTTGNWQVFTN